MRKTTFSLYWELRVLLYCGVLLVSAGLGTWVYQHLDRIDHLTIVGALAAVSVFGFYWCARAQPRFSPAKVPSAGPVTDYLLLLACLTFVTLVGYLQYQYSVFGWRLAGLIPLAVLAFSAYWFDHLGVLSLAITNLAAWLGIVVTPMNILRSGNWGDETQIYAGLFLGIALLLLGSVTLRGRIKPHFAFTYAHFGLHILCIASLAGLFFYKDGPFWPLWLLPLLAAVGVLLREGPRYRSLYLVIIALLYAYFGVSTAIIEWIDRAGGDFAGYIFYFLISPFGLVWVIILLNRKWKTNVRVQA